MRVFAIETSCDETAAAIVEGVPGQPFRVLAQAVYSQIDLHQQYGGVFPELASREHVRKIGPIIEETLRQYAKDADPREVVATDIDALAVTAGPGLIGSLLVGVNTAKSLAYALRKPLLGIHHHEGHIAAAWLESEHATNQEVEPPALPALALVVSGGHTQLVLMRGVGDFTVVGRTRDDAAGEAFDKVARLLDLPYPGGPNISRLASQFSPNDPHAPQIVLPRPMLDRDELAFSFSGLKTAVARVVEKQGVADESFRQAVAYEFQEAVVDVLVGKSVAAVTEFQPRSFILTGGVAANRRLRSALAAAIADVDVPFFVPPTVYCTDNAAMIGAAALLRGLAGQEGNWYDVVADDALTLPSGGI